MIIKSIEKYTDRICLFIDHKEQSYLCEKFEDESLWFNISWQSDFVLVDDEEIEELEKELKYYYRSKKLNRLIQ